MSEAAAPGAKCASHPDVDARWVCRRCGAFFCVACERRTRPDALPMCPACWALRATTVATHGPAKPSTALFTASLVLGLISLVPFPAVMLVSFVLGIVAIVQAKGPMEHQRWKGIVGLSLTCVSGLGWLVVFGFLL